MMDVLPEVAREECFALKGGTAINFFLEEMPRLSVDIDLTYVPLQERAVSLKNISDALQRVAKRISAVYPELKITAPKSGENISKLFIESNNAQVKVEPNTIIRGTVFPTRKLRVAKAVEKAFDASASMAVVSDGDLYGGKLCAALDRQHPRDLFDVRLLLNGKGITDEIRQGFVVYLAGHNRTMSELLKPTKKNIASLYRTHFKGMPVEEVPLKELLTARENLIAELDKCLTNSERRFLLSVKEGDPKWDLMSIPGIDRLPAIQWKLRNIQQMKPALKKKLVAQLKRTLKL